MSIFEGIVDVVNKGMAARFGRTERVNLSRDIGAARRVITRRNFAIDDPVSLVTS